MKKFLLTLFVFGFLCDSTFAAWVQRTYWVQQSVPVYVTPAPYWCYQHGHWVYPSPYSYSRNEWVQRVYTEWQQDYVPVQPYYVPTPQPYIVY